MSNPFQHFKDQRQYFANLFARFDPLVRRLLRQLAEAKGWYASVATSVEDYGGELSETSYWWLTGTIGEHGRTTFHTCVFVRFSFNTETKKADGFKVSGSSRDGQGQGVVTALSEQGLIDGLLQVYDDMTW
jgi:hypothetical protein